MYKLHFDNFLINEHDDDDGTDTDRWTTGDFLLLSRIVSNLPRTFTEKNSDICQFFPTLAYLTLPLNGCPLEFWNSGGFKKNIIPLPGRQEGLVIRPFVSAQYRH